MQIKLLFKGEGGEVPLCDEAVEGGGEQASGGGGVRLCFVVEERDGLSEVGLDEVKTSNLKSFNPWNSIYHRPGLRIPKINPSI